MLMTEICVEYVIVLALNPFNLKFPAFFLFLGQEYFHSKRKEVQT